MANTDLRDLLAWAASEKLPVTSSSTGRHNVGSKHYLGQAIDVDHKAVKDVNAFYKDAQAQGFRIRDERQRPPGQAVWGGPHFHVEIDNAARRGQRPQPAQRVAPASQSTQPVKPQGGSVDELLRQAEVSINGYRQQIQKQAGIATASGTFKQGVLPTRTDYNYSKPSTMNPLQSAWQGFQQPFNPYASQPEGLSGMAGEFAGRAALPVLAGLAGGGLPLIAGAGAATGAIREDTRQRKYNETPNLGKIGLSAATESLVAAPFLKGGFVPNALMGGGIAGAQSAVDQLNSTGQIDPGTLAKDAAIGGVLSGGLGKFFGPKPVPDIPAPDAIPDLRLLSGGRDPLRLTGGLEAPKALPGAVDIQTPGGGVIQRPAGEGVKPNNVIDIQARPTEPTIDGAQQKSFSDITFNDISFKPFVEGSPKPRVGGITPTFESDVDKALYIIANRGVKSGADDKFLDFAKRAYPTLDENEIITLANKIKPKVIELSKNPGGANIPTQHRNIIAEMFPERTHASPVAQSADVIQPEPLPPPVDYARQLEKEFGLADAAGDTRTRAQIKADESGMLRNGLKYLTSHPDFQDMNGLDFLDSIGIKATQAKDIGDGLHYRVKIAGETHLVSPSIGVRGLIDRIGVDTISNVINRRGGLNAVKSYIDEATRSSNVTGDVDALYRYRQYAERGAPAIDGDTRLMQQVALDTAENIRKIQSAKSYEELWSTFEKASLQVPEVAGKQQLLDAIQKATNDTELRLERLLQADNAQPQAVAQELSPWSQPQQSSPVLDTPDARLKRGSVVAPGDPEAIMSAQDLQAKKPGVYESLDPKRQAVVNRIGEAIQSGEVLEAPYMPKKGDTGQVGVKAFKPSHMSAAGNTLEVFGTNIEGQPNRLIIEDFRNPGASWGFQDVPTPSSQVVPDVATQPREAITPRAQSEAAIAQVKKLSEIAPNNRAVQNATRILEKDNLTIKDINRAKRVLEDGAATDEHLRGMMDQLKASEGTSNCG